LQQDPRYFSITTRLCYYTTLCNFCCGHDRLLASRRKVFVGVSTSGKTGLIFVNTWVVINGTFCHDMLLTEQLLSCCARHRRRVHLAARLCSCTPSLQDDQPSDFISPDLCPTNSLDLNPVDHRIWAEMQQQLYQTKTELKQHVWHGLNQ